MLLSKMFGVERDTDFMIKGYSLIFQINLYTDGSDKTYERLITVDENGCVFSLSPCMAYYAISIAPSGIIHLPPPLTDEQREQLKALWTLGYRWLAKNCDNNVYAYGNIKPIKECDGWGTSNGEFARIHKWMHEGVVASLVSWSDPKPYDIGKALGVGE